MTTSSFTFDGVIVHLSLDTDPALETLDLGRAGTGGDDRYEWRVEILTLGPQTQLLKWRLRRRDGQVFTVRAFRAQVAVPALDLHRSFVPVLHDGICKRDWISLPWNVRERSFTTWSFPLIAALNRRDTNRLCLGLMDHLHLADAEHTCYDEDAQLELSRTVSFATDCWEEGLYLSRAPRPILDEVRAFARGYDTFHQVRLTPAPPAAWEPVWCSWYGIKTQVDAAYIRRQAPLLADWGFGSIIVDAGWFRPDGFDGGTGHYQPDLAKFPDLPGLVREVQAQGLRLLLWCSPIFNLDGIHTQPFVTKHLYHPESGPDNLRFLCPRSRAVREYACRTVRHLLQTYGADGLKIDFIDPLMDRACLPCTGDHDHDIADYGEAIHTLLQAIHQTARAVRPDALIEFRMNYSTLATRAFATSHRAQDSPFDFDHIRRMCTRLKSYIVDPAKGREGNVAVHTDPAYWLAAESATNVACFMASLVTSAVPMLSMDLGALPAEHQGIVRAWLRFFRAHQDLILFGEEQLLDADPHHSLFCRWRGAQAVWGLFAPNLPGRLQVPVPGIRELWLLNGSDQEHLLARLEGLEGTQLRVQIYDRALEPRRLLELPIMGGMALLDLAVEKGGALEVHLVP